MKILHTKFLRDGRRHLLVELVKGESVPVVPRTDGSHYRLVQADDLRDPSMLLSSDSGRTWHAVRGSTWCPFWRRFVLAFGVLTGKYDALQWKEQ